jgi:hypothetical protein
MKKGFVVAVFLGVAFAAGSPAHHNDPAASAPAHSAQTSAKSDPAPGTSTHPSPQVATDQAITVNAGLASAAPQTFGWLILIACTVALVVAMATVVLTAAALRG